VPWFALVPFLWSIERQSGSLLARLGHGVVFGGILAAVCFSGSPALWGATGLFAAAFAAAAGPLLRSGNAWLALAGLPVLWTGIEALRGALGAPTAVGWLCLGHAAVPERPEAEIASIVGVHGLSLLFALGNTAFFLVFRARTGAAKLLVGAAATIFPLAIHGAGRVLTPPDSTPSGSAVVVASQARKDAANLIRLTDRLASARPRLVVWPGIPLIRIPAGGSSLLEASAEAGDLAIRLGATVVLGIDEEVTGEDAVRAAIAVVEPDGKIAGRRAMDEGGEPANEADGGRIFPLGRGRFGLAIGSELATSATARRLVRDGAGLLVLAAGHGGVRSKLAQRLHDRMLLFRAIETLRFLAKGGRHGAFLADPHGRRLASVAPGIEGAAVEEAALLEKKSLYVRAGWLLEPFSLAGAIGIAAAAALQAVRKRRPAPAPVR
jgi:apolipoprotein N-acyltransferase